MNNSHVLAEVGAYYSARLTQYGPTPKGVDWNSIESQHLRFEQLLKLCNLNESIAVGDYGCGYGALLDYLRSNKFAGFYFGYDIATKMIEEAERRFRVDQHAKFASCENVLNQADYLFASGIFNVRLQMSLVDWERYVYETLDRIANLGKRGFAFNMLTSYSDVEKQRSDLYYADPCRYFDLCKKKYSRQVALLHDYALYEFTILVRR